MTPLCKAQTHYKQLVEVLNAKNDEKVMADSKQVLDHAFKTRRVGMICRGLQEDVGKSKMRELARVPVKELRSHFGKEADTTCLLKPISDKVAALLAMR